jgi:hypothetical protein
MAPEFNSASDMDDIYRNMEKLHKKLKDLGYDLDAISDQLKLYHATEAKRIYQMRQAIIDWERITHYQKERLKTNKEEKDHRTKRNMEENAEYFRQIRRNMRIRQSHSSLNEQLNLTTKALFGGGLGLGTVFNQLIKGGKAVADSEEERADLEKDELRAKESMAAEDVGSQKWQEMKEHSAKASAELIRHLESPSSQLGRLTIFGKTISERLQGGSKFFKNHALGIMISIGSIGLLVTALKLVYNTSPMMQASVKLLGLMWNLGLRPIGDFFGFIMRPIFILFLRSFILPWYKVAYPFYQKWGNKIGELMSNFTLQGFADLTWEWFNEADIEMKTFSTSLALAIGATGLGGFIIILRGIKALYDKLFPSKTPTTTGTNTTTTKTPNPNTTRPALPFYHSQAGGTGTLNIGNQKMLPAPAENKNKQVGVSQNVKEWMNKQWKKIQMAGQRLNKSASQMWKGFLSKMNTNQITKKIFGMTNKLAGGLKGGILGFIPAIQEIILEAIDPDLYHRNREEMFEQYPFLRPDFDPANPTDHPMAQGGIIREPIYGVGRSGKTYSFGEQGAEMVTPMGKGVGGASITINIQNMSGSTQDLNNLRQTILAVIQEANTRGGRI